MALVTLYTLFLCVFETIYLGNPWPNPGVSISPLLLTMVLFTGPLVTQSELELPDFSLISLRNFVVAPIFEELVFRHCISFHTNYSPVFFSLAHLHHGILRLLQDHSSNTALIIGQSSLQLTYTLLFGAYASFIQFRTGRILDCIIVHSFCNWMGFPRLFTFSNLI